MKRFNLSPEQALLYHFAQWQGRMCDWINILPSYRSAEAAFKALPTDVAERIVSRAAEYGMDPIELMQKVPEQLWTNPDQLMQFLDVFDISHIVATSVDETLKSDPGNWVWEMKGVNRGRKAATMTGEEHRTAVDTADVWAKEATGEPRFFDFNGLWAEFKVLAQTLGYTCAWLDPEIFAKSKRHAVQYVASLRKAKNFGERLRLSHAFVKSIGRGFQEHKHETLAALLLAVVTLHFAPARWFIQIWAVTSLFGTAVHLLRGMSLKAQRSSKFAVWVLRKFNKPLKVFDYWIQQSLVIINNIKNGVFKLATYIPDIAVTSFKKLAIIVKPYVVKQIDRAKGAFRGFLGWVTGNMSLKFA